LYSNRVELPDLNESKRNREPKSSKRKFDDSSSRPEILATLSPFETADEFMNGEARILDFYEGDWISRMAHALAPVDTTEDSVKDQEYADSVTEGDLALFPAEAAKELSLLGETGDANWLEKYYDRNINYKEEIALAETI
jgi:hypothetical protein